MERHVRSVHEARNLAICVPTLSALSRQHHLYQVAEVNQLVMYLHRKRRQSTVALHTVRGECKLTTRIQDWRQTHHR